MWVTPEQYQWLDGSLCSMTIVNLSNIHPAGGWYYPLHAHEWYDLVFCVSGTGQTTIHSTTIQLKKGTVMVVKPHIFHSYYSDPGSGFGYCVLSFIDDPASPLSRFFADTDVIMGDLSSRIDTVQADFDLLDDLYYSGSAAEGPLFYSTCVQLMLMMQHALIHAPIQMPVKGDLLTEQILNYVHDHYREEDLDLKTIAAHFFISESQITRVFRKAYQITLMNYLIDYRICMAKDHLTHTDMNVKDVCVQVGYPNVSHFTRIFLKRVGMPPLEYRKLFKKHSSIDRSLTMSRLQAMYPRPAEH